jgi:hypothetical protein
MRIRQIKPEFWSDTGMAVLPIRARLTYIGLWGYADDAGWTPVLDASELGHTLYGYESARTRERWVLDDVAVLQERGHLIVECCGHAVIPTLTDHQRLAGPTKQVRTFFNEHTRRCVSRPADPRVSPQVPAGDGSPQVPAGPRGSPLVPAIARVLGTDVDVERDGTERSGTVGAQARDEEETTTEFRRLVGLPSVMGGGS